MGADDSRGKAEESELINVRVTFRPRSDLGRFVEAVVTPAVQASVQAACDLMVTTAKEYCPVDTGRLQAGITSLVAPTALTVAGRVFVDNVPYADYVEYGTGQRGDPTAPYSHVQTWPGMAAQPYMRPALDESREPIAELFRSNLSLALGG